MKKVMTDPMATMIREGTPIKRICLIMAGAVGLFHGFHPVTFSMVTVGLMLIEGVLLWDRKEKK